MNFPEGEWIIIDRNTRFAKIIVQFCFISIYIQVYTVSSSSDSINENNLALFGFGLGSVGHSNITDMFCLFN